MVRRWCIPLGAAAAFVLVVVALALLFVPRDSWIAYVVCDDKRIYEVDLTAGTVLRESGPHRRHG